MRLDALQLLRNFLQVTAFCLTISALQFAALPDRPYEIPLAYSLAIGFFTWALIDIGRQLAPSARDTGWPAGWLGVTLPFIGIIGGYVLGTVAADAWLGWSSWSDVPQARAQLATSLVITLAAGSVATYFFYSRGKAGYLQQQTAHARRQATEARLLLLQAQLEPHMLFNTLANLRVLIGVDPVRAQGMLDHLISYLRATLNASRAEGHRHTLEQEFALLEDYLALMAVRMGTRLQVTLDLPADLRQQPVPPLLLQPLVENSIRHGLEPTVDGGHLKVTASQDGPHVVLEVTDNGAGLDANAPPPKGFGIHQIRERLATLYPGESGLQLLPADGGGVRAVIHLPSIHAPQPVAT